MNSYLFTWNPDKWQWKTLPEELERVRKGGICKERWSCAHSTKPTTGDRAFLIRLGVSPKGIMASGRVTSQYFTEPHYNPVLAKQGKTCNYVHIEWNVLLKPVFGRLLTLKELLTLPFPDMKWTPESSGNEIPAKVAQVLEEMWMQHLRALNINPNAT